MDFFLTPPPSRPLNTRHLSVFLGKDALNETSLGKEQKFNVEKIIIHPGFDDSDGSYDNDIGDVHFQWDVAFVVYFETMAMEIVLIIIW